MNEIWYVVRKDIKYVHFTGIGHYTSLRFLWFGVCMWFLYLIFNSLRSHGANMKKKKKIDNKKDIKLRVSSSFNSLVIKGLLPTNQNHFVIWLFVFEKRTERVEQKRTVHRPTYYYHTCQLNDTFGQIICFNSQSHTRTYFDFWLI